MSRKNPEEHECDHVLIVEGHSDLLFYAAMLHHLQRLKGVFIKSFVGKSKILNRDLLSDFLNPKRLAEKKSIGILMDADNNPGGTSQSVKDHLKAITGRDVNEGGWQEQEGFAKLGFFVAPDAQTKGEVETLVWKAFADEGPHLLMKEAVDEFLEKMRSLGWETNSPDKGRIGAYLSAAYDEDPRLGAGAREKKFDFDAPGFARLRSFLEALPQNI
jgi:hypothetical protein